MMKERDISRADLKLIEDHGLGVQMNVDQARHLIDTLESDFDLLTDALDKAQGAVHSDEAGQAYVVIFINPE